MVNPLYSAVRRRRLWIDDASSDENTPPNVTSDPYEDTTFSCSYTRTATPLWSLPEPRKPKKSASSDTSTEPPTSPMRPAPRSPTTSSPALWEAPLRSPLRSSASISLKSSRDGRCSRHTAVAPYSKTRSNQPAKPNRAKLRTSTTAVQRLHAMLKMAAPDDVFVPAKWPWNVVHLRESFNPLATIFPFVPNYGWCSCSSPCRVDSCPNSLVNLYCNVRNCPYKGLCGNGLVESSKVFLGKNERANLMGVVAAEDIEPGEVLGQYLGEFEHVSDLRSHRPRNQGYRLVMNHRPERPSSHVRVAINAQKMGGLMRFVNHSCRPLVMFVEVSNGRRTTVVVATTHVVRRGQEVTVDYGDDLWFICRCGYRGCRHRDIQDQEDP